MESKEPTVYIIILNYKNFQDTINCLESLRQSDYDNARIIVVDNDSKNESLESIAEALDSWGEAYAMHEAPPSGPTGQARHVLVQSGANRGYAAGNNVGIRIALENEADYVLILNNDTIVPADFPGKLVEFAKATPDLGIVGPKVIERDGKVGASCARRRVRFLDHLFVFGIPARFFPNNWFRRRYFYLNEYNYETPKAVDMVSGCCMMVRSSVFRDVGLLDETTFLMCEELILAEKLRKTKFITYIMSESSISHFHGGSRSRTSAIWVQQHANASWRYFLGNYLGYSRLQVELAMLLRWKPLRRG